MSIALGRVVMDYYTNKSGGALAQGDVVIIDATTAASVTTTTTGSYASGSVGVVIDPNGIANNGSGMVAITGPVPKITLSASASLGDLIRTHTVAKQAVPHAAPLTAGDFGQVLGTGTTPKAILWGAPKLAAGSGDFVGPGSSTAGHIVKFADTSGKLGADATIATATIQGKYLLYDNTLSGAGTFDTDPTDLSGYDDLEILLVARGARTDVNEDLKWCFNNDTTDANYLRLKLRMDSNNTSKLAAADTALGNVPGNSGTAGLAGTFHGIIPLYAGTTWDKHLLGSSGSNGGSPLYLGLYSGVLEWHNTAAITRVAVSGFTTANLVAGSRLRIWGVKQVAVVTGIA